MKKIIKDGVEIVKKIDKKYNIERDLQLSFTQFMEEIGELAKEINKPRLRNKEIDKINLEGEFADVLLQLFILADMTGVDLEKALLEKAEIIKKRHDL